MQPSTPDKIIQTQPHPKCCLCGNQGAILYSDMKDPLSGAGDGWSIRKCCNAECELLWLDPLPLRNELSKIYKDYHTHKTGTHHKNRPPHHSIMSIFITLLWRTTLVSFTRRRHKRMYLDRIKPGKLLEVGCGNGQRLALLKSRGWEVVGQELDPEAAKAAESYSHCKVFIGELQSLSLPPDSFDAILMSHVIEHVYEPIELLKECHKILKPKGVLVVTTPNAESFGHQYFKKCWRGLESPRHFYIFSPQTLKTLINKIGFHNYSISTTSSCAASIGWGSFDIKMTGISSAEKPLLRNWFKAMLFKAASTVSMLINRFSGEECVLLATK